MKMVRNAREAREHRKEIIQIVENFGKKQDIPVRCESDYVLLYIKYILDFREYLINESLPGQFKDLVYKIHKETRGNHMDIGVTIPSTLACAIIHMAVRLYRPTSKRPLMSQKDIGEPIDMGRTARITIAFRKLDQFFQKNSIPYPEVDDN